MFLRIGGGGAGKADQENVFLPDRPPDVGRQLGLYAGLERGGKNASARGERRRRTRRRPCAGWTELVDHARPGDVGRDVADAAHHRLLAELAPQHVVLDHAVLQRQDRGVRSDGGLTARAAFSLSHSLTEISTRSMGPASCRIVGHLHAGQVHVALRDALDRRARSRSARGGHHARRR
jgi:hypothetical protein